MFLALIHEASTGRVQSGPVFDCGRREAMGNQRDANFPYPCRPMSIVSHSGAAASTTPQDEFVCWSRMQAEAGQSLEWIISRKERERSAGHGVFLWGVGNAPASITNALARAERPVRIVFSVMKSQPKLVDAAPSRVVAWRRYIDAHGAERDLPAHALVTSRADSASGPKRNHYALMCFSPEPLALRRGVETFDPAAFRNAGGTGAPVGHSQVTALLKRVGQQAPSADYEVNMSAWLTGGYWVRLTDPVLVTPDKLSCLSRLNQVSEFEWIELVASIREGVGLDPIHQREAMLF